MMKQNLLLALFFASPLAFGQTIDFGLDFKTNNNRLSNRFAKKASEATPGHRTNELGSFEIPQYNFGFFDDNHDRVYVRYTEVQMRSNFEIPVFVKYTTKNNFFFDLKMSGGKYRLEYQGRLFRDTDYYFDQYGSFSDYQATYGGTFDDEPVNGDPNTTYNDTLAYINWFDSQANTDPYSQASTLLVEELKFRSFHLWFGRKFLKHKRVQPTVKLGLHYRTAISSYKRKHFEIDDNYLGQVLTKRDLSTLTTEIPSFSRNTFGIGVGIGFDIYRYHFSATSEYSINLTNTYKDKNLVFDYRNAGLGFRSVSLSVGVDLFSHDFNSKNSRDIVYGEEFQSLTSALGKNRKWSLGVNVKSPILSRMNNAKNFSLLTIKDKPNPDNGTIDRTWQSLSFGQIDRISWTPKFEMGLRFNIVKRIDLEVVTAYSRVIIDTRVQEFNTRLEKADPSSPYTFSDSYTSANYAVYRSTYSPIYFGGNVYATLISKDAVDFRLYGGGGINWFALSTPDAASEFGVNGKGNDIYQTTEDVLFYGNFEPEKIENVDASWYSNYAKDVDLSLTPDELLSRYENAGLYPLSTYDPGQTVLYPTMNLGMELEVNRFLFGLSGEFSVKKVDQLLVKNYYNFNFNLGYILLSKNKLNRKLRD